MRLTLRELRQVIEVGLLEEGVVDVANQVAKKLGIVTDFHDSTDHIIAIDPNQVVSYPIAHDSNLPKVVGVVTGQAPRGYATRIVTLYADSARIAVMLLAAALEKWRLVVPDFSVSPAAKAVIQRYFEQNKDDPMKVRQDFDTSDNERPDYLQAAYSGPIGFDLQSAYAVGDRAVENVVDIQNPVTKTPDRVIAWLRVISDQGFNVAYRDPSKTGNTYDKMLADENLTSLITQVEEDLENPDVAAKAKAWVSKHRARLDWLLQKSPNHFEFWSQYVVPLLT